MTREEFLRNLIKYGNVPYKWGGADAQGLDCSGLTQLILAEIKLDPPGDQSAQALHDYFIKHGQVLGPADKPDMGDLAFYGRDISKISHVGVCLSEYEMLEAAGGGPEIKTRQQAEAKNAKVRVSAIKRRSDLLVVVRPDGLPWLNPPA